MNLLPTWLWKEWRDQRSVVVATALALPLLTLLFEFSLPMFADHPAVPFIAALVAFTIVVLALYGDVFAGEERRGTIAFLRRQPGGWWPPFAAKFLFLALVTVVICGEAFGFAALASRLLHGAARASFDARRGLDEKDVAGWLAVLLTLLVVPGWTIVVSIWFPRSVVALPGAAVVLVLFAAPIALTVAFNDGLWPKVTEVFWVLGLSVAAVPFIAAISFARGRAVERGAWRAGVVGAIATLALFSPAYAWTAKRACDYRSVEPLAESFRISSINCLATNGRLAWVTVFHSPREIVSSFQIGRTSGDGPEHALCVDLADGTWRELAGVGARVFSAPSPLQKSAVPLVVVDEPSARRKTSREIAMTPTTSVSFNRLALLDAENGAPVRPDLDPAFLRARDDAGARFQRLANYLVLPDGSHAWFEGGHLVRASATGAVRKLRDSEISTDHGWIGEQSHYGHGAWLGSYTMYDVIRERRFTVPERVYVRWVHDSLCIVADSSRKLDFGTPWLRCDEETHELAPIPGLGRDELPSEMADDGRLFVLPWPARNDAPWRLALLHPATGVREEIEAPADIGSFTSGIVLQARTPSGVPIVSFHSVKEQRWRFARFDLAARRFDLLAPDVKSMLFLVGCADEDSAVMTDGHRLLRARFGKPGVEVLFPKPNQ